MRPEILDYYELGGETDRLGAGTGRLEFLRTFDVLHRELPPAPASILDVGGATGVYAEPLAAAGYHVHVIDPVPSHVRDAAARPGVTAQAGDARDLPAADASVDAVLLFGPLYHLLDFDERLTAWREAARVVRPGGVVIAATISRYASLFDGFVKNYALDPRFRPRVDRVLDDGRQEAVGELGNGWFTSSYLHHPSEPPAEAVAAGLTVRRRVGLEGPMAMLGPRLHEILADPAETELMLEMLRTVEEEPSLLGISNHLLTIAVRP
ncbi:class I SAM-dependent methyltransferase [Paractinoplanes atraurantiacus]|uniref:Methyltransferase domain-containing protein n=1 Tax=Paractinoplanes atraurantiacus TaxID=1036182 RepID=A0A285IB57_9ACTN|nr:class I SAM-dependent methyltransferase [Actinoplanes atraurantiacus]SNY45209.1 Methyltransferase domain-containing protein [Actinoplanes atraurantiacus]